MSSPAQSIRSTRSSRSIQGPSAPMGNTTIPATPPRTPSPSSPTTPIYDRFTDPFRDLTVDAAAGAAPTAQPSVNTTPTPATPRMGRMPSTPSFVPFAPARRGSIGRGAGGPYGVRTPQPRTPQSAGRYEPCAFANCSTFSVDSEYSTAGESFYGDGGDDDDDAYDSEDELVPGNVGERGREGSWEWNNKHASYGTTASSIPSTPSSTGPITPLWPAFEVITPISTTSNSTRRSRSSSDKSHSHVQSYTISRPSPPRPAPAPCLWANQASLSVSPNERQHPSRDSMAIHSPSPVRSYRFLPADMVPAKDFRQQPSAASTWFAKHATAPTVSQSSFGERETARTRTRSNPPVRPSHPIPRAPSPFTAPNATTATCPSLASRPNAYILSEMSIFDPAPRQTLLADLEYITGKKLHFPLLSRWSGERRKKDMTGCRRGEAGKSRKASVEDVTVVEDARRLRSQCKRQGERERRGSCESWREKYAKREYWI